MNPSMPKTTAPLRTLGLVLSSAFFSLALGRNVTSVTLAAVPRAEVPELVHRSVVLGPVPSVQQVSVAVTLQPRDPAGLEAYAEGVSDPSSPLYRKFLKPEEVGARFGADATTVNGLAAYLRGAGMTVELAGKSQMSLIVTGSALNASKAFGTALARFRTIRPMAGEPSTFFANMEPVRLPVAFANAVADVSGLDDSAPPQPRALSAAQTRILYKSAPLYNGGLRGEGQRIGVSNFDGFRLSNLPLYYSANNLPAPAAGVGTNVKVVAIGGGSGKKTPFGEGDLDLQMVLGMAPLASVVIYDGTTSLPSVLARELEDNAVDIITDSWGWKLSSSAKTAAHNYHLAMTAQGITYVAASGDGGTKIEPYSYPNYEPEVLLVGGTVAGVDPLGNRRTETAWAGGGGGYSVDPAAFNVRPSWQKGNGIPSDVDRRLGPDLAMNAAGDGAYSFYLNGKPATTWIGTSFAAPLFAGMLAIAEQRLKNQGFFGSDATRLGRLQNLIYSQNGRSDVWFDVAYGSNGTLPDGRTSQAGFGWDTATGWGAIDMDAFVDSIAEMGSQPVAFTPASMAIYGGEGRSAAGDQYSVAEVDGSTYSLTAIAKSKVGTVASVLATFKLSSNETGPFTAEFDLAGLDPNMPGGRHEVYVYNFKRKTYELISQISVQSLGGRLRLPLPTAADYLSGGSLRIVERLVVPTSRPFSLRIDRLTIDRSHRG